LVARADCRTSRRLICGTSTGRDHFATASATGPVQAALVTLSRIGKQVVAKRSGHHIPLDEPDLVVAAIRDVL
jgi:hypothetical protein